MAIILLATFASHKLAAGSAAAPFQPLAWENCFQLPIPRTAFPSVRLPFQQQVPFSMRKLSHSLAAHFKNADLIEVCKYFSRQSIEQWTYSINAPSCRGLQAILPIVHSHDGGSISVSWQTSTHTRWWGFQRAQTHTSTKECSFQSTVHNCVILKGNAHFESLRGNTHQFECTSLRRRWQWWWCWLGNRK